jgi:hypothetical protein
MSLPATLLGACVPPAPLLAARKMRFAKLLSGLRMQTASRRTVSGVTWRSSWIGTTSNSAPILTAPFAACA